MLGLVEPFDPCPVLLLRYLARYVRPNHGSPYRWAILDGLDPEDLEIDESSNQSKAIGEPGLPNPVPSKVSV